MLGKKQSPLKGFHKANKSTVASALAHLILATNLPFKWVESRSVQRLLASLCPFAPGVQRAGTGTEGLCRIAMT